jgi:signal transduction histidine kinase
MIDIPDELSNDGPNLPFESYFDALPGIVSIQDRDLKIIHSNSRLREFFGDPSGCHCYEFFKRRTEKCPDCPVEESFRTGRREKTESIVVKKNGEEMPVMVFTSPIKNDDGEVIQVMKLAADITEVKKLQKKLFRAQQQLKQFFDEVPCYVSVQDRDLRLIAANRRFKEDFGDDVGGKCYEVYKHRDEPCINCPVALTFEDGQTHQSEEVVTSMSGVQYNVLVHTAPIRNETGEITRVVEMSTNITPIRKLQSQLESTGLLISSISHSIKGLLNGLDGGMYLVNSGLKSGNQSRVTQGWEMVLRNVDRIRSTVMNILYYAKERDPQWESVSPSELADEVFSVIESKAKQFGVVMKLEIEENIGMIEGDPLALRSALVNLLENSLDACSVDRNKTEHLVSFVLESDENEVRYEVTDNGIGMDRETREKIFSLFFSSKGTEGTGLGLFIANNIARAHGGTIDVKSEVGEGTRFVFKIPRSQPEDIAEELFDTLAD